MNTLFRILALSSSLMMPFLNGMKIDLKEAKEEQKKSECEACLSEVSESLQALMELHKKCASSEYCSSNMYPPALGNSLKNKDDQGAVCYRALTFIRSMDVSKVPAQQGVFLQDQLITIIKSLDDIGKYRLLSCFLFKDNKESHEVYAKSFIIWYNKFVPKIKAALDEKAMETILDCICFEPNLVAKVLETDSARTTFRAEYMDAMQSYVDWLEELLTSKKDEKIASKSI